MKIESFVDLAVFGLFFYDFPRICNSGHPLASIGIDDFEFCDLQGVDTTGPATSLAQPDVEIQPAWTARWAAFVSWPWSPRRLVVGY